MNPFDIYVSNSVAGSANQLFYAAQSPQTGRVFYKIACGGRLEYSLLFSNVIDSTFSDGSKSRKNLICQPWNLLSARVGCLRAGEIPPDFTSPSVAAAVNEKVESFVPLTFGGSGEKQVAAGETFWSDPLVLEFDEGDYLCLEMTVCGPMIPYHEESILPVFVKTDEGWRYGRTTPFAGMVGCRRFVKARIGYLGDSITQGIGVPLNSYRHWNALLSAKIGLDYAHWNLGIGYGRAEDLASDGAWLAKAKQNDLTLLCIGVNDLMRGFSAEQIIKNIDFTVDALLAAGHRVVVQTVPPFDYDEERTLRWNRVNDHIKTVVSSKVSLVFDTVAVLGQKDSPQKCLYGGHPNGEGCAKWAEALYDALNPLLF